MLSKRLKLVRTAALCALMSPALAQAAPATRTVTLITGDRVVVDGAGNASVHRAPGRESVQFTLQRVKDHLHVIPSDAIALLRADKLDPRLFDVTELIASGYHTRAATPVIMTGVGTAVQYSANAVAAALPRGRRLAVVDGVATAAKTDGSFWRDWNAPSTAPGVYAAPGAGAGKLWLDGQRHLSVEDNLKQIGADVAHERGLLGDGVTVAVIDSGIDTTHPDLKGKVTAHKNFISDDEDDKDYVGHGTHVASTIAGTGALSEGKYQGVAPHAKLIDAKVCGLSACPESAIIEGMEWAAEQGARIINMSLGGSDSPGEDLIEQTLNSLSEKHGALFVAAAGNDFVFGFTVGSPASAEKALAVGALDPKELPTEFSQRGLMGDVALKPELVAPGVDITAARSNFMKGGKGPMEGYFTASGTSMAAPHVSGAAALLSQQHPDWKADQLKAVLMGSAQLLDGQSALAQGAGLVNIPAALELQLHAEPAAVSFGRQAWPHGDDKVIERTLKLHNDSDAELKVDLAIEARAADGANAAADMFSLSTKHVRIAAHGDVEVKLTADTRKGAADGLYSGELIASNKVTHLHVPFIVDREVESYDLELEFIGRDGKPDPSVFAMVLGDGTTIADSDVFPEPDGIAKKRLIPGEYLITSNHHRALGDSEDAPYEMSVLIQPDFKLTKDTKLTLDARVAKPVRIKAPVSNAELDYSAFTYHTMHYSGTTINGKTGEFYCARIGGDAPVEGIRSTLAAAWLPPGGGPESEYQYHWIDTIAGELVSGYYAHPKAEDFIRVDSDFARGGSPLEASFVAIAMLADPGESFANGASGSNIALPSSRAMYYYNDPRFVWSLELSQFDFQNEIFDSYSERRSFEAGQCYQEQWNQAVFGPTAGGVFGPESQTLVDDSLGIAPSMVGDSQGRGGSSQFPKAHARLFRDGKLLKEVETPGLFEDVPAESASYRVEIEVERAATMELSTKVALAWEFVSEKAAERTVLPLSYIRFQPELSQDTSAPKGERFELPILVEPQPRAQVSDAQSLTVDVSFDDGATWAPAKVSGEGRSWKANFKHPKQSGYVSLRAAALDADDNQVEETIIRAYRLE